MPLVTPGVMVPRTPAAEPDAAMVVAPVAPIVVPLILVVMAASPPRAAGECRSGYWRRVSTRTASALRAEITSMQVSRQA